MSAPDWEREIDRWTERFRGVDNPPEPFATALREGWTAEARAALIEDAESHRQSHDAWLAQISAGGVDMVRFDCRRGSCGVCEKYCGRAFSLNGETEQLPPAPPMPICPACRHTLNILTPFFMDGMGVTMDDLIDEAQPFVD